MPLHPSLADIALRLTLTLIASGLIGLDRESQHHPAGLRTTILVGLAAAISMVQANLLLPVDGKTSGSFSVLDLMRLPLGILTGVGFIGAGVILKKGDMVTGVTTAATLWLTTVVGLCFGGGQLGIGLAGAGLALVTLFGLRRLEQKWMRINRAILTIRVPNTASSTELSDAVATLRCKAMLRQQCEDSDPSKRRLAYEMIWRQAADDDSSRTLLQTLNERFDVVSFEAAGEPVRQ